MVTGLVFVALFLLIVGCTAASSWADRYLEATIGAALDDNPVDADEGCPVAEAERVIVDHNRLMDWSAEHWWDG